MKKSPAALSALCALCIFVVSSVPTVALRADDAPKVAGVDVPVPKRTKVVMPEFPAQAQAQGLRGIVILDVIIDVQGHVSGVEVIRSVPPFDEFAMAAVRKWEYEVTRLDGKPVSVRLTVPITFALKAPEVTRQEGIPELRQGVVPQYPPAATGRDVSSVTLEITLDSEGRVAEVQLRSGDAPFSQALLQAVRTWRFAPPEEGTVVSFRVQADFVAPAKGSSARVEVHLTGLRRSESLASTEPVPEPPATPSASGPATAPEPPASPGTVLPVEPSPAAPLPAPPPTPPAEATPPAQQGPAPAAPPAAPPTAAPAPAPKTADTAVPPSPRPSRPSPAVEVLSGPAVAPGQSPGQGAASPPASSVTDVTLEAGVPDLVRGRRPVVPPLARMAEASGSVEVRFSVDASGQTLVRSVDGPDILKAAAEQVVASWVFRRVSTERLWLTAELSYGAAAAKATIRPAVPAE